MKKLFLLSFIIISFSSFSQTKSDYMTWATVGAKGKIIKSLSWSADFNTRFNKFGLKTFFPQVGFEYKVTKWFRPGIDYRLVFDKNNLLKYSASSSIRINLNFRHVVDKRLKLSARLRYQYSTGHSTDLEEDDGLNHLIRWKPAISYDIKGFFLTPKLSAEVFLNPVNGAITAGFTKVRYALGVDLDLDSPHKIGLSYRIDHKVINFPATRVRHILGLSYVYSF
ncbi:MAG: DUF2490 domain-containing protein [Crocinitomicaceae bacterium]|nr:DUF2490 domain-containing protein [Crocinitomicaceae bacterium]